MPDILEYVMWQVRFQKLIDHSDLEYSSNNTIATPILGMGSPLVQDANGTFTPNATFLEIQPNDFLKTGSDALHQFATDGRTAYDPTFIEMAPPMGVRCQALSELGTVRVNPDDSSFYDFVHVSPAPGEFFDYVGSTDPGQPSVIPFGTEPRGYLSNANTSFTDLLQSTITRPAEIFDNNEEYTQYFQPHELQQSLMRAYAGDALQLMYDDLDTFDAAHVAENLTASRPGKIFGPGAVPPHISAILFGIWALGCVLLGLRYGFRGRWAETLDGYSFFRFGADYAEEIGEWPDAPGHNTEFYENGNLVNLPGLAGDSRVDRDIGYISLMEKGNYARKNKLYN